jgi:hypothetical protein
VLPVSRDRPAGERPDAGVDLERNRLRLPADYSLGLFAAVASGLTPGTAGGGSLLLRGRHRFFSLSLEGRLHAPSGIDAPSGGRVRSGLAALVIAPCLHYGPGFGCVLALGGQVWASASDVTHPRTDVTLLGAVGARVGLEWPERGIWAIAVHADGFRALTRLAIRFDEQKVWSAPTFAAVLGGGAVVRF